MENDPPISLQPEVSRPARGISRGLFVAVSVLSVCTFLGLLAFGAMMVAVAVSASNEVMKAQQQVKALESRVAWLEDENMRFWIAADMYYGVTDSFYTNSVLFCAGDLVMMDIGVQDGFDEHYNGNGRFGVSDTDLSAEIYEMMLEFKHSYDNARMDRMADFEDLRVEISVYGYDLATFEDDVVALAD